MIVDFDDFADTNHRLEYLLALRGANPEFRCTLFAVPNRLSALLAWGLPEWMELAVHGWHHPHPREAEHWTDTETDSVLYRVEQKFAGRFARGFKSPGWMVSDQTYRALIARGYWIADHDKNNARRPAGIGCYLLGDDSWHGHIQNVCGNGIQETFPELLARVKEAEQFQFISEVVQPWQA